MIISSLFNIEIAKSKGIEDYESGKIPFVTSSSLNNGVVKYVDPYEDDRVFNGNTICISGLGHATCQLFPYLPKGNGGDSATILIPKEEMSVEELIFYTSIFNLLHEWRFSFGRKASKNRIESLDIPIYENFSLNFKKETTEVVKIILSQQRHLKKLI